MKISQSLVLLSSPIFLAGCGSYGINYNTVPQGASLICEGQHKGYTPTTLKYDVDSDSKKQGYFSTRPCYAKWASGVQKDYGNMWDLEEFPDGVMQTLKRPDGGDYSQDAEFALKVQRMRQQQQSAQNSTDAINSIGSAINQINIQKNMPKFQLSPPVPITFGPPSPWRSY